MQTLRKSYPYTHVHDDTSIAAILHEVAGADAVHNLSEAPTAITKHANAVNSLMSTILRQAEAHATDDDRATEQASAVTYDSESSADKHHSQPSPSIQLNPHCVCLRPPQWTLRL
jgi:hypothetical protein